MWHGISTSKYKILQSALEYFAGTLNNRAAPKKIQTSLGNGICLSLFPLTASFLLFAFFPGFSLPLLLPPQPHVLLSPQRPQSQPSSPSPTNSHQLYSTLTPSAPRSVEPFFYDHFGTGQFKCTSRNKMNIEAHSTQDPFEIATFFFYCNSILSLREDKAKFH